MTDLLSVFKLAAWFVTFLSDGVIWLYDLLHIETLIRRSRRVWRVSGTVIILKSKTILSHLQTILSQTITITKRYYFIKILYKAPSNYHYQLSNKSSESLVMEWEDVMEHIFYSMRLVCNVVSLST